MAYTKRVRKKNDDYLHQDKFIHPGFTDIAAQGLPWKHVYQNVLWPLHYFTLPFFKEKSTNTGFILIEV